MEVTRWKSCCPMADTAVKDDADGQIDLAQSLVPALRRQQVAITVPRWLFVRFKVRETKIQIATNRVLEPTPLKMRHGSNHPGVFFGCKKTHTSRALLHKLRMAASIPGKQNWWWHKSKRSSSRVDSHKLCRTGFHGPKQGKHQEFRRFDLDSQYMEPCGNPAESSAKILWKAQHRCKWTSLVSIHLASKQVAPKRFSLSNISKIFQFSGFEDEWPRHNSSHPSETPRGGGLLKHGLLNCSIFDALPSGELT